MGQVFEAETPCTGQKLDNRWVGPPAGEWVSGVQWGWDIADSRCDSAPMQEVGDAPENAVLGDEGAAGAAAEEGVDGGMIVEEEVAGRGVSECHEGEGAVCCIEFSCLLCEDPWVAWEKAGAHGVFPDANIEGGPGGSGSVSKEARC